MYCTGSTECLSCTHGSHSACAVKTPCSFTEPWQPDNPSLHIYIYCTGGTECLSCTPGTHSAIRTEIIFQSTPNRVLMAHAEWLPGVQLRHSVTTCAVHIEDCGGWWLSGCRGSMAEYWWLKSEVSWVRLLVTAGLFTFLYFLLIITSKFGMRQMP